MADDLLTVHDFQKEKSKFLLCVRPLNRSATL